MVEEAADLSHALQDILEVANAHAVLSVLHARAVVCRREYKTVGLAMSLLEAARLGEAGANLAMPKYHVRTGATHSLMKTEKPAADKGRSSE